LWEVWNEYVAESVFVDHKPTEEELKEIIENEQWLDEDWLRNDKCTMDRLIREYIRVEKMKVYTNK
jgi:hypothetical protein